MARKTLSRVMRFSYVFIIICFFVTPAAVVEGQDKLIDEFKSVYKGTERHNLEDLVKGNKAVIPAEVDTLTSEAMDKGKSAKERIKILEMANTMAVMHKNFNGDEKPLQKVEKLLKKERVSAEEEREEKERIKRIENSLGNIVMNEKAGKMASQGLAPVVYPHWMHQVFFECRTCHEGVFSTVRGSNNITQARIEKGQLCGKCHNGKAAFAADKRCESCHNMGSPSMERLTSAGKVDMEMIGRTAERLGSAWNPANLPGGRLPVDKFGRVDWTWINRMEVYKPVGPGTWAGVRDNTILFKPSSPYVQGVPFSHSTHTSGTECSTCHSSVFSGELNSNTLDKKSMAEGKTCGYCHGRTAFNLADCSKCHNQPVDSIKEGWLVHGPGKETRPIASGRDAR